MMKKTYIKPQVKEVKLKSTSLICTSPPPLRSVKVAPNEEMERDEIFQ